MSVLQGNSKRNRPGLHWGFYLIGILVLAGVLVRMAGRTSSLVQAAAARPTNPPPVKHTALPTPIIIPTATNIAAVQATQAAAGLPTVAPTPTLVPPTPTPTLIPGCELYNPNDDLLTRVDQDTALPREFEPDDLAAVPLNPKNAYFGPVLLRRVAHQPLLELLEALNQPDLKLQTIVVSGYRSYSEQAQAYEKWLERYPDRVSSISAVPGHSEHQIGTAVDFSTPYMESLFGEQFHPQFFFTQEGQWLANNAARFGFVMSYPEWAVQQTGYEWEPWHYRYVGVELAEDLVERNTTVSGFIQTCLVAG